MKRITSLYGLSVGQTVEWRGADGVTRTGDVVGFDARRSPVVKHAGGTTTFTNPRRLRPWRPPSTPEEIEAFLAGEE